MYHRKYQDDAVSGLQWATENGAQRIMLVAPPGSGKTKIVSDFLATVTGNVAAFSHRKEIRDQIHRAFSFAGVKNFTIHATSARELNERAASTADYVFVDECHHSPAKTFDRVFKAARGVVIGATATPYRADGAKLKPFFDAVVFTPSVTELSKHGFLSSVDAYEVSNVDFASIKKKVMQEFAMKEAYERVRVVVQSGDVVSAWDKHAHGKKAIIFCTTVQHCHDVQQELSDRGKKIAVVTGTTRPSARQRALQDMESGAIDGIVNCGVFTEGTDIRNVGAVIMLRPTMSRALLKQMIGRGLRNDESLTIIDHVGNLANHRGVLEESAEDCVDMVAGAKWKEGNEKPSGDGGTVLFVKKIDDALFRKTIRIPQTILEGRNVIFNTQVRERRIQDRAWPR